MTLTEDGLHFRREGDHWRCVEHPDLVMLRGGGYEVDGQGFAPLCVALTDRDSAEVVRGNPGAARPTHAADSIGTLSALTPESLCE